MFQVTQSISKTDDSLTVQTPAMQTCESNGFELHGVPSITLLFNVAKNRKPFARQVRAHGLLSEISLVIRNHSDI